MKTVFMGTPDFADVILEKMLMSGYEMGYVVTQPDKARNRGKKIQYTPVKEIALAHDIPVLQPEKVRGNEEFYQKLKEYNPDIIVVAAYGQILPEEILHLPKLGCINVHASLLPKFRGAAPIQHAILSGDKETGITIMQMEKGLDTGDMLLKGSIEIGSMNYSQLHDELAKLGAELLLKALPMLEQGQIVPEKQKDENSTYASCIQKEDGKIDFSKSPEEVERLIRGFDPWPGAFCSYNDMTMKLWKGQPLDEKTTEEPGTVLGADKEGLRIACGGKALLVTEIQVPGKKRVSVADYLRGNTIEKGMVLR